MFQDSKLWGFRTEFLLKFYFASDFAEQELHVLLTRRRDEMQSGYVERAIMTLAIHDNNGLLIMPSRFIEPRWIGYSNIEK